MLRSSVFDLDRVSRAGEFVCLRSFLEALLWKGMMECESLPSSVSHMDSYCLSFWSCERSLSLIFASSLEEGLLMVCSMRADLFMRLNQRAYIEQLITRIKQSWGHPSPLYIPSSLTSSCYSPYSFANKRSFIEGIIPNSHKSLHSMKVHANSWSMVHDLIIPVVVFVTKWQIMTSQNLNYYFETINEMLHHDYEIHLSTMGKSAETLLHSSSTSKFPKSNSSASLKTQPQFSFERLPFSRKVSEQKKQRLVQLITANNYNMMDAAKTVKISYSSAKKIFTRFRRNLREEMKRKAEDRKSTIRATYIIVKSDSSLQPTRVETFTLMSGVGLEEEEGNESSGEIHC